MNARIVQMLTKQGFTNIFWEELKLQQQKNPKITHQEVYEKLEQEYKSQTGQRRYASFRSFRNRRDQ